MNEWRVMAPPSTDSRLLEVAIDHFGRLGLEGASTRAIARDADTLMSSITYHFGGKEGLYLAAADHIAATMHGMMAPALAHAEQLCGDAGSVADARAAIRVMLLAMTEVMLRDKTASMARFVGREQAEPTEAFTRLYNGMMSDMHGRLTDLLIRVSGNRLPRDAALIMGITLIGQALVFRLGRATLMTSMGWDDIGEDNASLIARIVGGNIDAILDQLERGDPA
jgi:AcrR family transcriptional regulator